MADLLDPHARPPQAMRGVYKRLQKLRADDICTDPLVTDCRSPILHNTGKHIDSASGHLLLPDELQRVCAAFVHNRDALSSSQKPHDQIQMWEAPDIPGLLVYPDLFPKVVQMQLLNELLHRDLSNPEHKTNVHLHYNVPYPDPGLSYFSPESSHLAFEPKDPTVHKAFDIQHYLNKKLRWMTLGGQYDWTNKTYPDGTPPPFPQDLKDLLEHTFPMRAEAAIVNLYSPGDQLSLHRDVSEGCSAPLVSVSLGCDAIFLCGLECSGPEGSDDGCKWLALHLRSGDAVLMSGKARYAWHGVPKVLEGTCPEWMAQWPGGGHVEDQNWQGWMRGKRVNLNVRQMFA